MASASISPRLRIVVTAIRILLALVFIATGASKLASVPMMVTIFEQVGIGQWFRYVTGAIEVGGAILLLTRRFAGPAAVLLAVTMAGAILSHLTVVPGSPVPAAVLLALSLVVAWFHLTPALARSGTRPDERVSA